MTVAYSLVYQA